MKPEYYNGAGQNTVDDRAKFESCYLLSQQKSIRLRHLTQISALNLNISDEELVKWPCSLPSKFPLVTPTEGFYFTICAKKNEILFRSDFQTGKSPSWDTFNLKQMLPVNILTLKGILIQIWLKKKETNRLIVTWAVQFSGLLPIGQNLSDLPNEMAENSIIFRLMGWLYTSPDCLRKISMPTSNHNQVPLFSSFSVPLSDTKSSFSISALMGLNSKKRERWILEQKCETLQQEFEALENTNHCKKSQLAIQIERSKLNVTLLMKQLQTDTRTLTISKQKADQHDTVNQEKGLELMRNIRRMNRQLSQMKKQEDAEAEQRDSFTQLTLNLRQRRRKLLSQLTLVYPITCDVVNENHLLIGDVHLPLAEHYNGWPGQTLSVAVCYSAQLLVRIAHLVNLPLPFPVSLSDAIPTITDLTSITPHNRQRKFQLCTRNKEKDRTYFHYAVFLLNKNIAQLRWACGIASRDLRPTLSNLSTLLNVLCTTSNETSEQPDLAAECPLKVSSITTLLATVKSSDELQEKAKIVLPLPNNDITLPTTKHVSPEPPIQLPSDGLDKISESATDALLFINGTPTLSHQTDIDVEERQQIERTFEHLKHKYLLKRSNSEERISGLDARVSADFESNSKHVQKADIAVPELKPVADVQPAVVTDVKIDDSLQKVFSRTAALASHNYSFKFCKENPS